MMTHPSLASEPYQISLRFHRALWAQVFSLEANAQKDELFADSLEHLGHRQRQNLLVQVQRDDARRLRNFLARTRIRL